MNNKEWHALLLKYREGNCTKEEMLRIHLWYEGLNADGIAVLNDEEKLEMEERMLGKLAMETSVEEQAEPIVIPSWWRRAAVYLSAAAAVLIVVSFWAFFGNRGGKQGVTPEKMFVQAPNSRLITEENSTDMPKRADVER